MQQVESVKKRYSYFITYFLPLFLVGYGGSGITFLRPIFSTNARWVLLVMMFVFLSSKVYLMRLMDKRLTFLLFIYCGWCFLTSFWSEVPLLSFMKSGIFSIAIFVGIFAGIEWVRVNSKEQALSYLWLFAVVVLLASFFGPRSGYNYYAGLMSNSNLLGFMIAACFPLLLWKAYLSQNKKRVLYILICLSCFYFILLSMSRASILMLLITLWCFLLSFNLNKKIVLLLSTTIISLIFIAINPAVLENTTEALKPYINKGGASVLHSRLSVWEDSYEGAIEGGWLGLGYGVSAGFADFNMERGLTAVGYGREKGNSQLAIIEETGLIGLFLYLILITYLISKLIIMYFNASNQGDKILIGIITGVFSGLIVLSFFEGWWTSSGSLESIYFWILVGIARGIEISLQNKRVRNVEFKMETSNRSLLAG